MTHHRIIHSETDTVALIVKDEWPEPTTIHGRPVITETYFGIYFGIFMRDNWEMGHWKSSNSSGLITAWRAMTLAHKLKYMCNRGGDYDSTLCGIVIAIPQNRDQRNEARMRNRAKDFNVTVEELHELYDDARELWPSTAWLNKVWDNLSTESQEKTAKTIRRAIDEGKVNPNDTLLASIEAAELRMRTAAEQKEHEDSLIAKGFDLIDTGPDSTASNSLYALMVDIGVNNLVYTIGYGEMFDPSHFSFDDLDREIMKELIGTRGFCDWVPLRTSTKQPDDPTAHHKSGSGGVTMFWSDFGDYGAPRVIIDGSQRDVARVAFDRVTERFVLWHRPVGVEHMDDDVRVTIEELRALIGGADGPLPVGQRAPWLPARTMRERARRTRDSLLGRND